MFTPETKSFWIAGAMNMLAISHQQGLETKAAQLCTKFIVKCDLLSRFSDKLAHHHSVITKVQRMYKEKRIILGCRESELFEVAWETARLELKKHYEMKSIT